MAKLISKQTRENIIVGTILGVIVLFLIFYIIYPLVKMNDIVVRPEYEAFEDDTYIPENNYAYFDSLGLAPDTITSITDDNISLAALYFMPDSTIDSVKGTVVLIPDVDTNRTFFAAFIPEILQSGFEIVLYDQRSSGRSTGIYYSPGIYEGEDLTSLLADLKLRDELTEPVIVVGIGSGADAAIYASQNDSKIDKILAVEPYLTPAHWIAVREEESGALSIPLSDMVYFWWYTKKSGHPLVRTGIDDIKKVTVPTTILTKTDADYPEADQIIAISNGMVTKTVWPPEIEGQIQYILNSINSYPYKQTN